MNLSKKIEKWMLHLVFNIFVFLGKIDFIVLLITVKREFTPRIRLVESFPLSTVMLFELTWDNLIMIIFYVSLNIMGGILPIILL